VQSWLVRTSLDRSVPIIHRHNGSSLPETELEAIREFVRDSGKQVFTLVGYADAGYQDANTMIDLVTEALARKDPNAWLVSSGATACGMGAAYKVAKQLGFTTMGIVSTRAIEESIPLSPFVDYVFFVEDSVWGGKQDNVVLSPTSIAFVENSDEFLVIGGNAIARDEMVAAHQAGKPITYIQADIDHEIARARAANNGQPMPIDFQGVAHGTLRDLFNQQDQTKC